MENQIELLKLELAEWKRRAEEFETLNDFLCIQIGEQNNALNTMAKLVLDEAKSLSSEKREFLQYFVNRNSALKDQVFIEGKNNALH